MYFLNDNKKFFVWYNTKFVLKNKGINKSHHLWSKNTVSEISIAKLVFTNPRTWKG